MSLDEFIFGVVANMIQFSCAVCKERFTSRTKLFDHIRELEHAAPVPAARGGKKNKR